MTTPSSPFNQPRRPTTKAPQGFPKGGGQFRASTERRTPPALTGGGGERIRTDDLLLAKQALSQLSYTPLPEVRDQKAEIADQI
jgi:hypothetical protein